MPEPPRTDREREHTEREVSNTSVNGKRLTWEELCERQREELTRLRSLAGSLGDLDRCEHGRHEGDACTLVGGCGGPSHGNPIAQNGVLGYDLSGRPVHVGFWLGRPSTERQEPPK